MVMEESVIVEERVTWSMVQESERGKELGYGPVVNIVEECRERKEKS